MFSESSISIRRRSATASGGLGELGPGSLSRGTIGNLLEEEITLFYAMKRRRVRASYRWFAGLVTLHLAVMFSVLDPGAACAAGGEAGAGPRAARHDAEGSRDVTFAPGSAIQVTIWQEPDLSGDFSIDSRGYVILPLIGKVNVSRFTPESLESYLQEEYASYLRNPIIQTLPLIRVSVLGYVREPGLYRVEPDRPLWDVIAMAGGPSDRGDVTRMFVSRQGLVRIESLLDAYEEGISMREVGIESGDQIIVPTRKGPFPWRMIVSFASIGIAVVSISTRR